MAPEGGVMDTKHGYLTTHAVYLSYNLNISCLQKK